MNMIYDVIIIGSGPAGMTASVYASRANLKTLLLDRGAPGGQLLNTEEIENYPGFSHISGPDLAQHMFEHAQKFGTTYAYGEVTSISKTDNLFTVFTSNGDYISKTVIVATGTKYKKLGIPGEDKFTGGGVSWCAVCDGAFFRNQELVVVGGGDSAVEEAVYLTKFASKVTLVHRRDTFRAQPILVERLLKNEKIQVVYNTVIDEIKGGMKVTGVVARNDEGPYEIPCGGVFEYVGMNPISEFVKELGVTDHEGWIVSDHKMKTDIPGLFAAGDIRQAATRQVVSATADGCVAALSAQHYIESLQ
jgi:thioredoxin reductase (NADPH)